jgi:hypothetical protein
MSSRALLSGSVEEVVATFVIRFGRLGARGRVSAAALRHVRA